MKRFSHPDHGFHTANDGFEALRTAGWSECGWEVNKPPTAEQRRLMDVEAENEALKARLEALEPEVETEEPAESRPKLGLPKKKE